MKFWAQSRPRLVLLVRIALLAIVVASGRTAPVFSQDQKTGLKSATPETDGSVNPSPPVAQDRESISLLPDDKLSEDVWQFISPSKTSLLTDTWQLQQLEGETVLVCRGEPYGYLKSAQDFSNFQLKLEWRFPADENGNSGILLYTKGQEKDKVWPTAIQVQLHQPVCGSIFPSGEAKSDNEIREVHDICKAVNQWNSCEITSVGGRLSVEMNGKKVGVVTGCRPNHGGIALQSEGSEVHFRRIRVTELAKGDLPTFPVSQIPETCVWPRDEFGEFWSPRLDRRTKLVARGWRHHLRFDGKATQHVVYRNSLATDGDILRARHLQRSVVAAGAADAISDRHNSLRSRHHRHLRR